MGSYFTNGGFAVITILFITRNIRESRQEYLNLQNFHKGNELVFMENCSAYQLSNREIEVVRLIQSGMKYKEIAEKLFISEKTVSNHVQHIFEKVKVSNKTELIHRLTSVKTK